MPAPLVFTPVQLPQALNGGWGVNVADIPTAVNTNDGDTSRICIHNSVGGTASASVAAAITIPDGVGHVRIHFWATHFGDPPAACTVRFGIQTDNGNIYWGPTYQQINVAGTGSYDEFVTLVDCTTGGIPTGGSNKILWEAFSDGSDNYWCNTYITAIQAQFSIAASSGAHGSVTPTGSTLVTAGDSQAYTIAPALGYHILDVTVDGGSIGAASSYTFTNVQADHTISATFALTVAVPEVWPIAANGVD